MFNENEPALPRCVERRCRHFEGASGGDEEDEVMICTAYPEGIQSRIAYGTDLHLTVAPDQVASDVYEQEA
jgi:hypothetical protein